MAGIRARCTVALRHPSQCFRKRKTRVTALSISLYAVRFDGEGTGRHFPYNPSDSSCHHYTLHQ